MVNSAQILPFGRAVADAVSWHQDGLDRITLVAKATYALGEGAPMELLDPEPFRGGDLAPFRTHADVLVTGDPAAHPEGVDVALERGGALVATRAAVIAPRPEVRPSVTPVLVPPDVDWATFQEAPLAQRAPLPRPGDRLVVGPYHGILPRWRGVVYVADPGAAATSGDRLDMDPDAVDVDLPGRRVSLVYRSVFVLDGEDDLAGRVLHVGIEPDDEEVLEEAEIEPEDAAAIAADGAPAIAGDASSIDAPGPLVDAADPLGAAREPIEAGGHALGGPRELTGGAAEAAAGLAGGSLLGAATSGAAGSSSSSGGGPAASVWRADPTPMEAATGSAAAASTSEAATQVKRSAAASKAPTLPGTAAVRSALYQRFSSR